MCIEEDSSDPYFIQLGNGRDPRTGRPGGLAHEDGHYCSIFCHVSSTASPPSPRMQLFPFRVLIGQNLQCLNDKTTQETVPDDGMGRRMSKMRKVGYGRPSGLTAPGWTQRLPPRPFPDNGPGGSFREYRTHLPHHCQAAKIRETGARG